MRLPGQHIQPLRLDDDPLTRALQLARIEYLNLPKKERSYRKIAAKYKTPELNVNRCNLQKAVRHGIWGKIGPIGSERPHEA